LTQEHTHKDIGLRGIEVADTNICLIEGKEGKLFYRGYNIEDLVKHSTYEEVAYLLINLDMPSSSQLNEFSSRLIEQRNLPQEIIDQLQQIPRTTPSMNVLQSGIALLASCDPEISDDSRESNLRKAIKIVAKIPTIVSTWERIRTDQSPIEPDETLSHAANFLYMLQGSKPETEIAKCFDTALTLHAEHSFNASTFTARVITSTGADLYSAIAGAVGALSGKLHGGANSRVMENLNEIDDLNKTEGWVKKQFDQGNRIMGMGHAVYKTIDPRARILQRIAEKMSQKSPDLQKNLYEMTKKMAEVTQQEFINRKGREIYPNVDLYSASVYSSMDISSELFTPIFAISRTAGWIAHALEEKFPDTPDVKPVLYRPSADYTGNYCGPLGCVYTPLEERTS
jgi:citrate synthase